MSKHITTTLPLVIKNIRMGKGPGRSGTVYAELHDAEGLVIGSTLDYITRRLPQVLAHAKAPKVAPLQVEKTL